jgi:hypothetical protein
MEVATRREVVEHPLTAPGEAVPREVLPQIQPGRLLQLRAAAPRRLARYEFGGLQNGADRRDFPRAGHSDGHIRASEPTPPPVLPQARAR